MRILLHDYCGHPFQVQLSRNLARRGHTAWHLFSSSFQTPHGALAKRNGDPASFDVCGISLSEPFNKYSFIKRRKQEIEYGRLVSEEVDRLHPDVVISANMPIEAQKRLVGKCRLRAIKFIFWAQDFYSVAVSKILRKKLPIVGDAIGWAYMRLERSLLKKSDEIVVITEDFRPLMERWGVDQKKIHVIENWAPLDEVPPMSKNNDWSRKHELDDKFCFLYSGTLGLKHNPDLLLKLAVHFKDNDKVRVVVVSEGLGADWLKEKKARMNLNNLLLLEYQPYETLPNVLASADILMAILEPDAGVFSVPSKVLTYLCVGRPQLLAVPQENLAARIVSQQNSGIVVPPDDVEAFVDAAETLIMDEARRKDLGMNARRYAESHFDINKITSKFEKIITGS